MNELRTNLSHHPEPPLPFAPATLRAMSQPGHEDLEVRIPIPVGREWP